jgi:hypothetical protein
VTTPHDPRDPVLTEEEEREVAALLADVERDTAATTPPEVVSRLDDVLAGLVAERAAQPHASAGASSLVTLSERRQHRRWPRVLLAAAAVVGGGYAVGNVASDLSGSGQSSDSAGGATSSADDAGDGQVDTQERGDTGSGLSGGAEMSLVPSVRSDHLAADVRRVVRLFGKRPVTARPDEVPSAGPTDPGAGGTVDETSECPVPRLSDGQRLYRVRYRGAPAALVVGPQRQGSVGVTVYACADGGVRLARTVPAP